MGRPLFFVPVLVAVMLLSYGYQASAQGGDARYRDNGPSGRQLSSEKQQELEQIYSTYEDSMSELRSRLRSQFSQLEQEFSRDRIDESSLSRLVSDINQLRSRLFEQQVAMHKELIERDIYENGRLQQQRSGRLGALSEDQGNRSRVGPTYGGGWSMGPYRGGYHGGWGMGPGADWDQNETR